MRVLLFILQKEFIQIFRDSSILRIIFSMPIVQLIVLPFAANYDVRNINLSVVDNDHSPYARRLVEKMVATGYFHLTDYAPSFQQALSAVEADKADVILTIPNGFERGLIRDNTATVHLAANAVNGVKGGLGSAYAANIIRDFNSDVRLEWLPQQKFPSASTVEIVPAYWFNPHLNYKIFMVPGLLAVLVTMVGAFLSALNIVREKEIGTIEQLNVTPMTKWQFLLGKLIPFWLIGLFILCLGLTVAWLVFGIVPLGSYGLLLGFAAVYLLAMLGFGLLISAFADTQQQAMFLAFFFIMIFILLSGLYTSIDAMPTWAKTMTRFNPVAYFVEVSRLIILKGSRFADLHTQFQAIGLFALIFNSLAIWTYRKRS